MPKLSNCSSAENVSPVYLFPTLQLYFINPSILCFLRRTNRKAMPLIATNNISESSKEQSADDSANISCQTECNSRPRKRGTLRSTLVAHYNPTGHSDMGGRFLPFAALRYHLNTSYLRSLSLAEMTLLLKFLLVVKLEEKPLRGNSRGGQINKAASRRNAI